jgi:pimeloyl-ACP methyl ester carboxylesterase
MSRSDASDRHRSRRRWRPLWTLLGLFGVGVVATFLSSRRIDPMEGWDELLDEGGEPPHEPFPSTPVEVPGPGGRLHVDDGGTGGLPVLMVHGLGGSAGQWAAQLAHLRSGRRALAVDLRGHGRSAPPGDGEYGIGDLAADVAAVADDLGLARFVLVGHSLGAAVAIEVASRESGPPAAGPGRVAGLVLVDPNGDQTEIPKKELDAFLASLRADPRDEMRWYFKQVLVGSEPATAERVLADLEATPPEALVEALASSFEHSPVPGLERYLERYRGPVLSVISDMNTLPYSLHNLLPDLPVRQVAGTSHWLMMDRPADTNRLLDAFLEKVESVAAAPKSLSMRGSLPSES